MDKNRFESIFSSRFGKNYGIYGSILTTFERNHVISAVELVDSFKLHEKRIRAIPGKNIENESGALRPGILTKKGIASRNIMLNELICESRNVLRNSLWILLNKKRTRIDVSDVTRYRLHENQNLDMLLKTL